MTEPAYDSTGEPANEAARAQIAAQQVSAAQREAAGQTLDDDDAPAGSWRARLREFEPDIATMWWDDAEWEIPAKMPNTFYEAVQASDGRGMISAIIGPEGMMKLRIPTDIDAELLGDLAAEIAEAAGRVWSVKNLSRSVRRSRSTTRR